MGLIITLILGGFIGWLASIIMKTNAQMGMVANVIVGIVGSMLGGWIAGMLGMGGSGGILHFAFAIGGAALLIVILQKVGFFKKS